MVQGHSVVSFEESNREHECAKVSQNTSTKSGPFFVVTQTDFKEQQSSHA